MKRILTAITIAFVLGVVVQAQAALTGKWEGKTKSGNQVVLDLVATKTTLTGTLTESGQALTITDGKVSKNTFTFTVSLGDRTEAFTGEVTGDQMTVWIDRQGRENAAVLKRVKK